MTRQEQEPRYFRMSENTFDGMIMTKAIAYSESANFECEISRFRQKYRYLFEDHQVSNRRNGTDDEQVSS